MRIFTSSFKDTSRETEVRESERDRQREGERQIQRNGGREGNGNRETEMNSVRWKDEDTLQDNSVTCAMLHLNNIFFHEVTRFYVSFFVYSYNGIFKHMSEIKQFQASKYIIFTYTLSSNV